MKKNLLVILAMLFCCLFAATDLSAQDVITKKDGTKLKVIIKEMSDTEVKYVDYRDVEGVVFVIDRSLIREIKFSYGKKVKEEGPNRDDAYYVDDRMNNIKLNFTSINAGFTILTYERALDLTSSLEATLKIPGLGRKGDWDNLSGLGLDVGYKLKLGSVFKKDGYRPKHLLEGGYFRIQGGFIHSKESDVYNRYDSMGNLVLTKRETTRNIGHLGLDFGKQWVLSNKVVLDIFIGYHYYMGEADVNITQGINDLYFDDIEFRGGDVIGGENNAISFGIRVGGLFGKYGDRGKKK